MSKLFSTKMNQFFPSEMNFQQEVGYVTASKDFLVYLDGFPTIKVNDMVESSTGLRGWVNALHPDKVEVLMVDEGKITPGEMFKKTPYRLAIPVGDFMLGRAINPLGVPIDGKGLLSKTRSSTIVELEQTALGIQARKFIDTQFVTGMTVIDTLIPIGKGQRELILGDAHSGKTGFLLNLIVNQRGSNTICIYASIGKTAVAVRNLIDVLRVNKALDYTIVVAASSSEIAPLIFLTPKTALSIAEYFQKKGKDVLIILDDLGNHAKIHREISLLGEKSPGRESYPGDVFYQHAHLLERAGNFKPEFGGGSITALPVIELNLSDFTTLIPTNLMSMTDGHLLFRSSLYNQGHRPAIDISLSVSRVGRQTQDRIPNMLSGRIKQVLSRAEELETVSRFSSELPFATQQTLRQGQLIEEMLNQEHLTLMPKEVQVVLLSLPFTGFMSDKNKEFVEKYKKTLVEAFLSQPKLLAVTKAVSKAQSDQEIIARLETVGLVLQQICP